ncbi:hypothetical protein J6590_061831 [Homalodisca vitripennis]|nr:hypothetical protein J6590_061831 [Homalodisca vitripennis]
MIDDPELEPDTLRHKVWYCHSVVDVPHITATIIKDDPELESGVARHELRYCHSLVDDDPELEPDAVRHKVRYCHSVVDVPHIIATIIKDDPELEPGAVRHNVRYSHSVSMCHILQQHSSRMIELEQARRGKKCGIATRCRCPHITATIIKDDPELEPGAARHEVRYCHSVVDVPHITATLIKDDPELEPGAARDEVRYCHSVVDVPHIIATLIKDDLGLDFSPINYPLTRGVPTYERGVVGNIPHLLVQLSVIYSDCYHGTPGRGVVRRAVVIICNLHSPLQNDPEQGQGSHYCQRGLMRLSTDKSSYQIETSPTLSHKRACLIIERTVNCGNAVVLRRGLRLSRHPHDSLWFSDRFTWDFLYLEDVLWLEEEGTFDCLELIGRLVPLRGADAHLMRLGRAEAGGRGRHLPILLKYGLGKTGENQYHYKHSSWDYIYQSRLSKLYR